MIIDLVENAVVSIQTDSEPYYSYGTWIEEANRLTNLNRILVNQDAKFPLVFLFLSIRESYNEGKKGFESTLRIYIIDKTDEKYTPQQRHANEMPALRVIETSLLKALKINKIFFNDYDREEFMYNENILNRPVNAIELEIPAYYQLNCN